MFVVNTFSDNSLTDTYLVGRDHIENDKKAKEQFTKDWEETLQDAKEKDPQDWSIDQVINRLKEMGWNIIYCSSTDVEY